MCGLDLNEEDLDDVIYEEEQPWVEAEMRWMTIVCVHMDKEFSSFWFFKNMRTA